MPVTRWMLMLALAFALGALAASCGGGGKKSATPTAGSSAAGTTTPGSGGGSPAADSSSTGGGGNVEEVKAIAQKFGESTFKADYTITGAGSEQFSNGRLTLEKDGASRFRFDVTANQNGQDVAIIFIETSDVSAFCLKNAGELGALIGVNAAEGVCFKSNPNDQNNPVGSLNQSLQDLQNANVSVLDKSSRTVAGQDTNCYRTKDNDTAEISTTCFNGDGVIMYVEQETGDPSTASTIEATSVSRDVNGGDFTLPYQIRDLPTGQ